MSSNHWKIFLLYLLYPYGTYELKRIESFWQKKNVKEEKHQRYVEVVPLSFFPLFLSLSPRFGITECPT